MMLLIDHATGSWVGLSTQIYYIRRISLKFQQGDTSTWDYISRLNFLKLYDVFYFMTFCFSKRISRKEVEGSRLKDVELGGKRVEEKMKNVFLTYRN